MRGTSNIQRDSSEDIVGGILEIALTLRRKYNYLNIVVCGLLPRDENWSVNRIYIKELNDYLSYKCDLTKLHIHEKLYKESKYLAVNLIKEKKNKFYKENLKENIDKPRELWKALKSLDLPCKKGSISNICLKK